MARGLGPPHCAALLPAWRTSTPCDTAVVGPVDVGVGVVPAVETQQTKSPAGAVVHLFGDG